MTAELIQSSITQLIALRQNGRRAHSLAFAPRTDAEAYAIQDGVMIGVGAVAGAWKAGLRPDGSGNCAPIYASDVFNSPATVKAADYGVLGIEAEVGFRIGRDLPRRAAHYSAIEILEAVSHAVVTIEIVNHRFVDVDAVTPLEKLADNQANGALVVSEGVADWRSLNLMGLPAVLMVGGKVVYQDVVSNPVGDPTGPLVWLANHLTSRNGGLRAGAVVTCGSCTGLVTAAPGDEVTAHFGPLGVATVRLAV
ncbi:MAG: 2-keto-4-pentenoate hydratase [Elsteraceae bacterium]